ncbi:DUF1275 domain-containing protein [Enterococcus hirae]|nr:DUF1275 domain-containing protein [Enterococcus hirae]
MTLKKTIYYKDPILNLSLIVISGMIECYTYLNYSIFASAQTGNMILFALSIHSNHWAVVKKILIVNFCFIIGTIIATLLKHSFDKNWLPLCFLYVETLLFLVLLFLPKSIVKLSLIAFIDTFQLCFFNYLKGYSYNSFFITGDLKQFATAIATYLLAPSKAKKEKMFQLGMIPIAFCLGAYIYLKLRDLFTDCFTIFLSLFIVTIISSFSFWNDLLQERKSKSDRLSS